jgi:CotH kinase protein/Lamin Tail Domain/Secretion system C-terminal sorting domain/Fn3 associated/Chitobiase/beta-hexosaminidase C-terminal domain
MTFTNKIVFSFALFFLIISNPVVSGNPVEKVDLHFSHERGFYYDEFTLTILCDTPDSKIRYTLDGSNPLTSSSAIINNSEVSILINPSNTNGRDFAPGYIVTACVTLADTLVSDIKTNTYLFPNMINLLSRDNQLPGPKWLRFGGSHDIDYGMDPDIYNHQAYSAQMEDAFLSIPTFSVVTDLGSLFHADSGIYVNSFFHGEDWERNISLELLQPDGSEGFQINCGIRIRGGWSRHFDNPKHAFRIFFRGKYGKAKLKFPLFGDNGTDEFDKIDLRTSQNYSWSYYGDANNTFLRDVFSRDTQRDMGQPHTRSMYYHLFINGTYWGLYQTQERSEASFAQSYFGGNNDDFDVIKVDVGENYNIYNVEATDGTLDKWKELWDAGEKGFVNDETYFKVQGLNSDLSPNPQFEKLLDVDNLIDYMVITFFVGDFDGPISAFRNNGSPNNFYAIYNRANPDGFKFFRHDAEHSMFFNNWGIDRTGPFSAGRYFKDSNPQWIHQKLSENKNYRLKFSDRVYKHFFNNGALTLENNNFRIENRKDQIQSAIVAESARWGDSKSNTPLTKANWTNAVNFIFNSYLPPRNNIVLNQLKSKNLFSSITPPQFSIKSGIIDKYSEIQLSSPSGIIYYTLDGTDPSSATAILYSNAIQIVETTLIKTRSILNGEWSPLNEGHFVIDEDLSSLKITELHYHPLDQINAQDTISGKEFEFIELKNIGLDELNLTGSSFVNGISFTFPLGTIIPSGEFLLLASNSIEFTNRYGFTPNAEFEGQLDNGGEKIVLINAANDTIISFTYNDKLPWPEKADGEGYSLVSERKQPTGDPNNSSYWVASATINGSPNTDDLVSDIQLENNELPLAFSLDQNYPNPFNPMTSINYSIPVEGKVELKIFDILGNEIITLVDDHQKSGNYLIQFNGSSLSSGIYFYRLKNSGFEKVMKMVLLR